MDKQRKDDLKYAVDVNTTPPNITINEPFGNRAPQETKDWERPSFRFFYKLVDTPCRVIHGRFDWEITRRSNGRSLEDPR